MERACARHPQASGDFHSRHVDASASDRLRCGEELLGRPALAASPAGARRCGGIWPYGRLCDGARKPVPAGCAAGRRGGRPGVPGFRHLCRSLLVASACRRFGYGFRLLAASAAMNRMSGSVPCLGRNFSALSENRGGMSFVDLSGLSSRVVPSLRPGFGRVSVRDRPCGCRAMNIRSGCSDFRPFSVRRSVWPPFPFFDAPDRSSLPCGAACRFCRSFAVSLSEASPEGVHTLCVRPVRLRSRRPGPGGLRTERAERTDCGFSVSDRPVRQKNGRRTFRSVSRREYAVFAV